MGGITTYEGPPNAVLKEREGHGFRLGDPETHRIHVSSFCPNPTGDQDESTNEKLGGGWEEWVQSRGAGGSTSGGKRREEDGRADGPTPHPVRNNGEFHPHYTTGGGERRTSPLLLKYNVSLITRSYRHLPSGDFGSPGSAERLHDGKHCAVTLTPLTKNM